MRCFVAGMLLLLSLSCRTREPASSTNGAVQFAVIDTMFAVAFASDTNGVVALNDSTAAFTLARLDSTHRASQYEAAENDSALVEDWAERSRLSHSLQQHIDSAPLRPRIPVQVVDEQARSRMEAQFDTLVRSTPGQDGSRTDQYWSTFFRAYPNALGSLTLSAIGYNRAGNRALLVTLYGCGGCAGRREWCWLNGWRGGGASFGR